MQKAVQGVRILQGLIFTVFGLNGFLDFLPPPEAPEAGTAFLGALAATGYMFPVIKLVEIIGGVMLLAGRFVPLGLTLLAPIIVNIFLFHLFLDPANMVIAVVVLIFEIFLAWAYRGSFSGVLAVNARPTGV